MYWSRYLICRYDSSRIGGIFLHSTKKGHHYRMKWWHTFMQIFYGGSIIAHKYLICVYFLTNSILLQSITLWFLHHPYFVHMLKFEENSHFIYGKGDNNHKNSGDINSTHIRIGCTFQLLNYVLDGGLIRVFYKWMMPWSYFGGNLHLDQMNCRWNHCII